ncbi:MAG: hypothetical protein ABI844_15590 [Saprospiraceae bacterium]
MKELKFLKVLSSLNESDLQKFERFLDSPYCNSNKELRTLFTHLRKSKFGNTLSETEKKAIWKKLYDTKPFVDSKWRRLCNEMLHQIFNFFTFESVNKEMAIKGNLLLKYIHKNNLGFLISSTIALVKKDFEKFKYQSSEDHYHLFEFEKLVYDLMDYEVNMEKPSNLSAIHSELDLFYLSEKIKQIVTAQSRLGFFNLQLDIKFESEIIEIIEKNKLLEYPEISIYYTIYNLRKNKFKYFEIKSELIADLSNASLIDALVINKEIINFCILQLNDGQFQYAKEILDWYKLGLRKGWIFPDDKFNPGDFLNIVVSGIRTKEFTWTENFIDDYQKIIPKKSKRDIVTFSFARLYFNQQKFGEVIEKLRDVEFDELTYNLDAKVLLLATYFEVEEWQALSSLADSFRTFLHRHEKDITPSKKLRYSNFIKYTKKLSRVKYQDKKAKHKVLGEIQGLEGVVNQGWLIEKAKSI